MLDFIYIIIYYIYNIYIYNIYIYIYIIYKIYTYELYIYVCTYKYLYIYITLIFFLWDLSTLCVVGHLWPLIHMNYIYYTLHIIYIHVLGNDYRECLRQRVLWFLVYTRPVSLTHLKSNISETGKNPFLS